jgi:hypothetical protein
VFDGDAVEVIYVTAPGGYKFRFKFYFEWELIEMPSANGTFIEIGGNKDPIFPDRPIDPNTVPATGVCGPEHFAPASLGIFASKLGTFIIKIKKKTAFFLTLHFGMFTCFGSSQRSLLTASTRLRRVWRQTAGP